MRDAPANIATSYRNGKDPYWPEAFDRRMNRPDDLHAILGRDPMRCQALQAVAALDLPEGCIAAGFVRDAVWDHLHGYGIASPDRDVDVVWYDAAASSRDTDRSIERELRAAMPQLRWSVKNQARMHSRNGDRPYASVGDAMCHWPETATAVAVRLARRGSFEIDAPFGLDDLFALRLRPTPAFRGAKLPILLNRLTSKGWKARYPRIVIDIT